MTTALVRRGAPGKFVDMVEIGTCILTERALSMFTRAPLDREVSVHVVEQETVCIDQVGDVNVEAQNIDSCSPIGSDNTDGSTAVE